MPMEKGGHQSPHTSPNNCRRKTRVDPKKESVGFDHVFGHKRKSLRNPEWNSRNGSVMGERNCKKNKSEKDRRQKSLSQMTEDFQSTITKNREGGGDLKKKSE